MKIKELIVELSKHPKDAEVAIWDADTNWSMPIHVGEGPYGLQASDDKTVYIFGYYNEVISR